MKKEHLKNTTVVLGNVAKKIAESAVHAAVFSFVSKKVSDFMSKQDDKEKLRVEDTTKNTAFESTERI